MVYFSENVSVKSIETGQEYQYPMKRGGDDAFIDPYTRSWRSTTPIPELQAILKKSIKEKQSNLIKLSQIIPSSSEDSSKIEDIRMNNIATLSNRTSLIETKPTKQKTSLFKILGLGLIIFVVFILLVVAFF